MDKNPNSTSDDVTVFLDTSLDSRLAISVSGNDTISDLKRKFEHEHQLSYGGIKIRALKVDRRGCLYRLSDSMLVKRAAGGVEECFLFADASVVEKIGEIEHGSHNVGSDVQLIGSGICDNPLISRADHPVDVLSKGMFNVDDSVPLLLEGNKNDIVDQNGPVDSGRETSNDLEMGIKHCDDDRRRTSYGETINRPEPETQAQGDRGLWSEGFRVPTAQEHKEDSSRKEASEAKSSSSLEKTSPAAKNKLEETKHKSKEPVHLKENDAPIHGINEKPSRIDFVTPEDSLGNKGGDVPCDTFVVNRATTEEPSRALASNLDNRSDTGIHGTNDTYKETEVSGKHTEIRKDISMHCNTTAEDASQSQTTKKKRKFESTTDLEDSLKENNVLISDSNKGSSQKDASQSLIASKKKRRFENITVEDSSKENKEASQPEIASELSVGKTVSTTLDSSVAETSDMLTKSSIKKKNKNKKKALNPLHQVVDAAPPRSGYMEERTLVASAGINIKYSSGEDVAPISRQCPKEDNCAPIQELQENPKASSSLDFNNATQEKPEGNPPIVVEAPGENRTSSAERVQEKREPSQTNDSEAMLSKSQGKPDGNKAKLIVTSELSNINEPVTASKKKKKKNKTKDSTGVEQIKFSQSNISLAESHEGVHGVQDIDEAKNKESNLSQKNMVPNKSKNDVVASGELCAEEVTKSKGVDNKLKPKKNRKAVDSSGCSHDLQSPLKSHDNQGIGGKSQASRSSSMQPQGSITNVDVVSQPAKTVSKNGTKAQPSDASGKINSIPKVAGKQSLANGSVANSLTKKKNEAVAVPSSKMEKSNITDQNKPVRKHQSGVTQNVVASGKASGNDDGEVLNSSKYKSSATPVAPEYRNESEGKVGVVSDASTSSSEYSLSSESDYSDGESNAGSCASSGKKDTGRGGYSSIKGKPTTRLKNDEIFLNSSVYKKAKLAASQSQHEEDSQAPEFVPDSQPAL